jgi:glycerol uptake facilitator-like aquaporin
MSIAAAALITRNLIYENLRFGTANNSTILVLQGETMENSGKSGGSFLVELVLGATLAFIVTSLSDFNVQQISNSKTILNIFFFVLISTGVLFTELKYAYLNRVGRVMTSLSLLCLGAGITLIINIHSRS